MVVVVLFRCIHGDLSQHERNGIIHSFKKQEFPILVATDVAARGLDIPHIRNVVNFDVARDIDTHTHRVGRTGRAGIKGTAYTLVTEKVREILFRLKGPQNNELFYFRTRNSRAILSGI